MSLSGTLEIGIKCLPLLALLSWLRYGGRYPSPTYNCCHSSLLMGNLHQSNLGESVKGKMLSFPDLNSCCRTPFAWFLFFCLWLPSLVWKHRPLEAYRAACPVMHESTKFLFAKSIKRLPLNDFHSPIYLNCPSQWQYMINSILSALNRPDRILCHFQCLLVALMDRKKIIPSIWDM